MDHKRLFVGIPVETHLIKALGDFKYQNRHHQDIRWVAERNLHVTTFFIGKTANSNLEQVEQHIEDIASITEPFQLTLEQLNTGPPGKKARMFWAIFSSNENFARLSLGLARSLSDNSVKMKDPIPHITLARFKYLDQSKRVNFNVHFDKKILMVKGLVLWESVLHETGAEYQALASYKLGDLTGSDY